MKDNPYLATAYITFIKERLLTVTLMSRGLVSRMYIYDLLDLLWMKLYSLDYMFEVS